MNTHIPFVDVTNNNGVAIMSASQMLESSRAESYQLFRCAVDDIKAIRKSFVVVTACSLGKDSTVTLLAALSAHKELMAEGVLDSNSPFVISHINTMVENHLMEMLCLSEIDKLRAYCQNEGINLDLQIGKPALSKQWSSLFLSSGKTISVSRNNSDCAILLKVNVASKIEKSIEKEYKGKVVTLLGSRLSESHARRLKMESRGTDKVTAKDLISGSSEAERVFAPIMTMDDEDVWNIIRAAGTNPIVNMGFKIESWGENHRLLNLIYADSKDGACQISAKTVKGTKASPGGCGASARTGCSLCCKSVTDKSGEEQIKQVRHSTISGNILKVRNYIMYVAQDIRYRTYHSRAIDHTTGAIALQPNVLKAEIIEEIIWQLAQCSVEDAERAQRFSELVEQNREIEDAGYRDIVSDETMDAADREVMAETYKKYAQRHLIKPMSLEIAIYLSAIHSRDGVRLPPHRAVWIWNEVVNGARRPYPDVDPKNATVSDIPDAVMALPEDYVPIPSINEFDFLSLDDAESCEVEVDKKKLAVSKRNAELILGEIRNEAGVTIRGINSATWVEKVKSNKLKLVRKKQFSKRAIKSVSRVNGGYKVTGRGRTSVGSPSFSLRNDETHLQRCKAEQVPLFSVTNQYSEELMLDADEANITGYDINVEAIYDWLQFGGLEAALQQHNDAVEMNSRHSEHIYFYGGISAYRHYARYGVLRLNKGAMEHTKRIMQRTTYFARIGLLSMDEESIIAMSMEDPRKRDRLLQEYRNTRSRHLNVDIKMVLKMADYRAYKAKQLMKIRELRNQRRQAFKKRVNDFENRPLKAAREQLEDMCKSAQETVVEHAQVATYANTMLMNNVMGFDDSNYKHELQLAQGVLNHIFWTIGTADGLATVIDSVYVNRMKASGDWHSLVVLGKRLANELGKMAEREVNFIQERVDLNKVVKKEDIVLGYNKIRKISAPTWMFKKWLGSSVKERKTTDVMNVSLLNF